MSIECEFEEHPTSGESKLQVQQSLLELIYEHLVAVQNSVDIAHGWYRRIVFEDFR